MIVQRQALFRLQQVPEPSLGSAAAFRLKSPQSTCLTATQPRSPLPADLPSGRDAGSPSPLSELGNHPVNPRPGSGAQAAASRRPPPRSAPGHGHTHTRARSRTHDHTHARGTHRPLRGDAGSRRPEEGRLSPSPPLRPRAACHRGPGSRSLPGAGGACESRSRAAGPGPSSFTSSPQRPSVLLAAAAGGRRGAGQERRKPRAGAAGGWGGGRSDDSTTGTRDVRVVVLVFSAAGRATPERRTPRLRRPCQAPRVARPPLHKDP